MIQIVEDILIDVLEHTAEPGHRVTIPACVMIRRLRINETIDLICNALLNLTCEGKGLRVIDRVVALHAKCNAILSIDLTTVVYDRLNVSASNKDDAAKYRPSSIPT